ncbi:MAG: hypothetical protein ACHQQQ_08875 [Bacteroidota bacterium]
MKINKTLSLLLLLVLGNFVNLQLFSQTVQYSETNTGQQHVFSLSSDKVVLTIAIDSNKLSVDELRAQPGWIEQYGSKEISLKTDANFSLEIMWTDWQAPKFVNNAENPVTLNKTDFIFEKSDTKDGKKGAKDLNLYFKGSNQNLFITITYRLEPNAFYMHRKVVVSDTGSPQHFLQKIRPIDGYISGKPEIVKNGGFGQPIGFNIGSGGGFFGYEYPAADNIVQTDAGGVRITCGQEIGEKIGKLGLASEWAVEGLTPNTFVKLWFMNYIDAIRVSPLKPYTLYNSWYDLRSPEYPRVPESNFMNEKNIFRIIDLIKKNMIEKHHIALDAFVLDDGWDVYKSDWVLRSKEFPNGLKPISDELKKTNTSLGMWFGPIGGYSFRKKRLGWMKEHGYEVVGDQMCVAGEKYSALLKKRVTDFTEKDGVGYFKWDGIQFSCNEPDHGHPVGIYSRRAVMESVIGMVDAVRSKNPNMFLNITSGTWLSPWWVKYANQIWMQGEDYGYADVPSISPRDAAITYRDLSLYEDFKTNNFWFPIQNLMTHGIIKGNLEKLGGEEEPLDKFTNEALLYFARGVSMWELYISPDILTEGEWDNMSNAILWAKDRFPILSTTEMIGGDPKKRETYGYAHFKGSIGIIAARNPWIAAGSLAVELSPADGLDPNAENLVLEKVYPNRWVSPQLYKTGSIITIPLDGFETAIYEIYPLADATMPLIAGTQFDESSTGENSFSYSIFDKSDGVKILNPDVVQSISSGGSNIDLAAILSDTKSTVDPVDTKLVNYSIDEQNASVSFDVTLDQSVEEGTVAILLDPGKDTGKKKLPRMNMTIDSKEDTAKFVPGEGNSTWYTTKINSGKHYLRAQIVERDPAGKWSYHISTWIICKQKVSGVDFTMETSKPFTARPMPPRPLSPGERVVNVHLGEGDVSSGGK